MAGLGANDPCVPSQYQVKEIKEIWGVRYAPNAAEPPSRPYSPCPLRLRQARQSHQDGAAGAGRDIGKVRSEYMCSATLWPSPYVTQTAYWVPLSKLIKTSRAQGGGRDRDLRGQPGPLRETRWGSSGTRRATRPVGCNITVLP